jgi:hypothetical protein
MVDGVEDTNRKSNEVYAKAFYRWIPAVQNDFAARIDWCTALKFEDANHRPVAKLAGAAIRSVKPGEKVTLTASATDPDGDELNFRWWQYHEADSAAAIVAITNATSQDQASFVVPNEPGKQLHIILEVTDDGVPTLVGYQRVIFDVKL